MKFKYSSNFKVGDIVCHPNCPQIRYKVEKISKQNDELKVKDIDNPTVTGWILASNIVRID